jgi:hypothetical protein
MNKKEIVRQCMMIYSVFDDLQLNRSGCEVRDYGEIRSFAWDLLDREKRVKAALGEKYDEIDAEYLLPLNLELFETGFGFGYAIGRLFDTRYPKIENAVKSIQSLLKERALLPYFPRERKERRTT